MYQYNTKKEPLILKEYGRNLQNLVNFVRNIKDEKERKRYAEGLLSLMRYVNPNVRNMPNNSPKLWNDMFHMVDYKLDVESPVPIQEKSASNEKPAKLPYKSRPVRMRHYGRNLELFILQAAAIEDPVEQEKQIFYLARLMKNLRNSWNGDNASDDTIIENIKQLAGDKLKVDFEKLKTQAFTKPNNQRSQRNTKNSFHKRKSSSNRKED